MDKKIQVIIMLSILLVGSLGFGYKQNIENNNIEAGKAVITQWACMDGCFNMLLVIYGNVSVENNTQESAHITCSNICYDKYLKNTTEQLE